MNDVTTVNISEWNWISLPSLSHGRVKTSAASQTLFIIS